MARINWSRALTATGAAALAATAIGVGNMSQASAGASCSYAGAMCVFADNNYQGESYSSGQWAPTYLAGFNDKISSIENHSGTKMCFFEAMNYGGNYFVVNNNWMLSNLGGMNDRISSYGPCDQTLSYRSSNAAQ